jgi:hypothetical protein
MLNKFPYVHCRPNLQEIKQCCLLGFLHIPFWSIACFLHIPMPFYSLRSHSHSRQTGVQPVGSAKTLGTIGRNSVRMGCGQLSQPDLLKAPNCTLIRTCVIGLFCPYFCMYRLHSHWDVGAIGPFCLDLEFVLHQTSYSEKPVLEFSFGYGVSFGGWYLNKESPFSSISWTCCTCCWGVGGWSSTCSALTTLLFLKVSPFFLRHIDGIDKLQLWLRRWWVIFP